MPALATADVDQARAFVARELGGAGVGGMKRPGGSPRPCAPTWTRTEAAAGRRGRLNVHENTVAYRLRQAEEILGRSVDKRTLELRVALAVADLVGEPSGR